ncbi:EAL domain-containing protein [Sphingomicrobium clamense]|uniref:EAL domain-containing protein n=1 Tax=Sphingomicrobium clamense TaxID=2851013 RepID=A0ABS6V8E7_9SPHN|nr:EAL domain-containing protein [Sphingomicrobium sp. B8]MBW0145402.1 EAL domain-containing protein [Sphingomicrobium sp. B8]
MDRFAKLSRLPLVKVMLLAAVVIALWAMTIFTSFEHWLQDARSSLIDRQPTNDVVIVEIDSRSISELDQWPWPRSHHAKLVDRLTAAGASTIAFDIDFSSPSYQGDVEFAAAIEKSGKVVLPIFYSHALGGDGNDIDTVNRPLDDFSMAWVGAVNIYPDTSGTVRDYPAAIHIDGQVTPSLATVLAANSAWSDLTFSPDWSINPWAIPRYAFVDVIEERVPANVFLDKRVIVGSAAVELGDRYAVPVHGIIPGVFVQALAADSLMQGRAMAKTGWAVTVLGILLIALCFRPRKVARPARYALAAAATLLALLVGPLAIQASIPLLIDSAPWIVMLISCAVAQFVLLVRQNMYERARSDAESGLPNRLAFEEALDGEPNVSVVIVASIHRFADIREGMGMAASSEAVVKTASRLSERLGVQVHRIAPDLIAWLDPAATTVAAEKRIRIAMAIFRNAVRTSEGLVDVQLSFGVDADMATPSVSRIEHALAAAESARREGLLFAVKGSPRRELRRQLGLMSELRSALHEGRVSLAYQPKFSLSDDRIVSVEALVRWKGADGQNIPPDHFIPLAETTGMVTEVTLFALRETAAQLVTWQQFGHALHASVNISPVDLAESEFVSNVEAILEEERLDSSVLTLEITESAFIRSPAQTIASLKRLRELGLRLSIDDYGTGLSTLSYLQQMPVQELKIDRCFIEGLSKMSSDQVLVRSTIEMAHELGLTVVAEGVEDKETLELLRRLGCDQVQGYLIGRPMTAGEIMKICGACRKFVA